MASPEQPVANRLDAPLVLRLSDVLLAEVPPSPTSGARVAPA
uniref:Uncharacterized protein n=1 Tax=Arundo donax TaxID=35708 RepID=A0A0A9QRB3_ARUDO